MSLQNAQAIRGLYEAFNRGDLGTLEKGFSRDVQWNEAESSLYAAGSPYRGFAGVRDGVFGPTTRDFDQFRCDVEQLLDAGDTIVGTGRYRGTCKATGKALSVQFCHIMHLDPFGKLDFLQEYCDTLAEAEATGWTQPIEKMQVPNPVM